MNGNQRHELIRMTAAWAAPRVEKKPIGSPIVGCAQPPSIATKPCTLVVSTLPGGSSLKVTAGGRPVHIATLSGITDGVPPGALIVSNPGQVTAQG